MGNTVFYCNESYDSDELTKESPCDSCGKGIVLSIPYTKMSEECAIIDVRLGQYVRKYHLCKDCAARVIHYIDKGL